MKHEFSSWTPVAFQSSEDSFTASVWGRSYTFEHSFLPTRINIQGREILALPSQLTAKFGDVVGQWNKYAYQLYSHTEEEAVVLIAATCGNIILNAAVTIAFDGFIKLEYKVVPFWEFSGGNFFLHQSGQANFPCLTELFLDLWVTREASALFHFWPNTDSSIRNLAVINSGSTVARQFPFKPYLWTGNERCGLGICCESAQGLQLADPDNYAEVSVTEEYTNLHLHLLDSMPVQWEGRCDRWVDALPPLCFTFGLQATPVKPMPENMEEQNRKYHIYRMKTDAGDYLPLDVYDIAEKAAAAGVKFLVPHADWCLFQNHGRAEDEEKLTDFIAHCHRLGLKVLLYFGYEYSTLLPDWHQNADIYLAKNDRGHYVGGWQRSYPFMQRDYLSCYNSSYSQVMIDQVVYAMERYGADGLYADGTYVPWECANERHGCGWRDAQGQLHVSFPIFAVREHVKKLYAAVHKRGGYIDAHQSGCCITPTLSFTDSYFDGENIQEELELQGMEFLDLAAFRTEYIGTNLGIPAAFLSNTTQNLTIDLILARSLIHNIYPGIRELNCLPIMEKLWAVSEKYDLTKAVFHPYWEQGSHPFAILEDNSSKLSYYEVDGGWLLVAAGFCKDKTQMRISLPPQTDAVCLVKEETACNVENSVLTAQLGYCQFGVFFVGGKSEG